MYNQWIETLKASPLFRGINAENLNTMLECLKPARKEYRAREIVALNGNNFDGIGIVASGKVALTRETFSGNRVILEILGPPDIFGEMVAFSNLHTWPVTVIAHEDCCLFFLPPAKVLGNCSNICRAHSSLIMNVLNILSNKTLLFSRTIEHLSARNIRGKISSYLLDEYRQTARDAFRFPLKRHELADYLGMPRPSLSRELAHMKKDDLIDYAGPNIQIKDIVRLEQALE